MGRPGQRDRNQDKGESNEIVVKVKRCAKVMKGGKRFSFAALVVVGDRRGSVGFGHGKAKEVPFAVEKAIKDARKNMITVPVVRTTIPHTITAKSCASIVMLRPACPGPGSLPELRFVRSWSWWREGHSDEGIRVHEPDERGQGGLRGAQDAPLEAVRRIRTGSRGRMNLTQAHAIHVDRRSNKRICRGLGSGKGKTGGRGGKGQSARSGWHSKYYFEGGQMPLVRKLPKRGFSNFEFRREYVTVNLCDLEGHDLSKPFDPARFLAKGW